MICSWVSPMFRSMTFGSRGVRTLPPSSTSRAEPIPAQLRSAPPPARWARSLVRISLSGTPVGELLTRVRGYWDLGGFLATMGLQVHPSPAGVPGLIDFGVGVRATKGDSKSPGCFTVTSIDATGQPAWEVNDFTEKIVTDLMAQEGYLGSVFATGGGRQYTFTAWRDVEAVSGMQQTAHRDAMRSFNAGTLGTRLMTSVWIPVRLNPVRVSPGEGERPQREEPLTGQWL